MFARNLEKGQGVSVSTEHPVRQPVLLRVYYLLSDSVVLLLLPLLAEFVIERTKDAEKDRESERTVASM